MLVVAAPLIVTLLYSREFLSIVPYIETAAPGTIFRAVSWSMAYVILARGDGRTYLITELSSAAIAVVFQIWGYTMGGLTGLGIAYSLWYMSYTLIIALIYFRRYRLRLGHRIARLIVWSITASVAVTAAAIGAGRAAAAVAACMVPHGLYAA